MSELEEKIKNCLKDAKEARNEKDTILCWFILAAARAYIKLDEADKKLKKELKKEISEFEANSPPIKLEHAAKLRDNWWAETPYALAIANLAKPVQLFPPYFTSAGANTLVSIYEELKQEKRRRPKIYRR